MHSNQTTNNNRYNGFLIFTDIIDRDGVPHARVVVNFPLLGLGDPRYPIYEYVCPAAGVQNGLVQAKLAIDRVLNGEIHLAVGHEPAPEVAAGAKRGTFTLTVSLDGRSYSHTWKTPTTFTFQDEATQAATNLFDTYKKAASWQK